MALDEAYARAHAREVEPGQYVVISVTDTGSGMTPEVIERAFEPFFTTKPVGQGTGLGLSMLYGFIKQSRGHVRILSEPGRGTTFRLYLPRGGRRAEDLADQPAATVPPRAGAGERVLVVEDEPAVRAVIMETLQDMGFAAVAATDGPAALHIVRGGAGLDLMIADLVRSTRYEWSRGGRCGKGSSAGVEGAFHHRVRDRAAQRRAAGGWHADHGQAVYDAGAGQQAAGYAGALSSTRGEGRRAKPKHAKVMCVFSSERTILPLLAFRRAPLTPRPRASNPPRSRLPLFGVLPSIAKAPEHAAPSPPARRAGLGRAQRCTPHGWFAILCGPWRASDLSAIGWDC